MKHNQIFSFLCIIIYIIHSGCSIPKMVLNHENQIDSTYESKGLVKIGLFEDNRPDEERIEDQIAVNSLSPQIWSGSTSPEIMLFLQKAMIEEAERTQLFVVEDEADLELSGYVTSLKVDRRVTVWRYLGIIPIVGGILASYADISYLWIGLGVGLLLSSLDFPVLSATIEFHAILKLNGSQIFEKDIKVVEEDNYSGWAEWGWKTVSDKASVVLDKAITKSINLLFEEINSEI